MHRMVSFRLNRDCRDISVNPAKVLYVCHYEHGASCIHFGKDCFVRVHGEMDEVVARIEAALSDTDYEAPTAPDRPEASREHPGVN